MKTKGDNYDNKNDIIRRKRLSLDAAAVFLA